MGWFTKKPATPNTPIRVDSIHLSEEPNFTYLTFLCVTAAGANAKLTVNPGRVAGALRSIAMHQVNQWFTAINRPHDGQAFLALIAADNYIDQHFWDYLTGDPEKIAIHNRLAELLTSEHLINTTATRIQEGHYNHS